MLKALRVLFDGQLRLIIVPFVDIRSVYVVLVCVVEICEIALIPAFMVFVVFAVPHPQIYGILQHLGLVLTTAIRRRNRFVGCRIRFSDARISSRYSVGLAPELGDEDGEDEASVNDPHGERHRLRLIYMSLGASAVFGTQEREDLTFRPKRSSRLFVLDPPWKDICRME